MGREAARPAGTPAEITEQLYAALAEGRAATIARLLHPRARLWVPGGNPLSGTYTGSDGLKAFTSHATAIAAGGTRTTVLDIMSCDTHAAVLGVSRARRQGRADLENRTLHLLAVSGGQVIEVEIFDFDQEAVDRFWS